jgi:hypothetical protein
MNDPLLPNDPVEQVLRDSLATLSARGVRPSLVDVQHRARRRQRRRAAAMAGACIVVVLGGAGVLATRHDSRPLSIGAGGASTIALPATTIACFEAVPTTIAALDPSLTTNVGFGLTTTTTDPRTVVASFVPVESTTTDPTGTGTALPFLGNPCSAPNTQWRCQGQQHTVDGWTYFEYCEPLNAGPTTVPPTTDPFTTDPFTTYPTGEIAIPTTAVGTASTISAP